MAVATCGGPPEERRFYPMHHQTVTPRCQTSPVRAICVPSGVALLVVAGACVQDETFPEATFTPEVVAAAALPLSENDQVALLADERIACVVDSYEIQVRCLAADGKVVGIFGRKGEGPGEFGSISYLARGEEGTVGVHDSELGRFTIFEPSGAYVSEVMVPVSVFSPLRSFDAVVSGVSLDFMAMLGDETSGSLMTRFDVDIVTGEVIREEPSPAGPWDVACGQVIYGTPNWAGEWVFVACEGHLIFVDDTGDATVLRAPTYLAELPDQRDVARRERELVAFNRGLERLGLPPSQMAERLERYRTTPERYFLGTEHQLFDAANRYWVATQRDTHEWSYLDIYERSEYVGSVKIRNRLRGFDLLGSTLVALVDRQADQDDPNGIPARTLEWYNVGDLELGR